VLAITSAWLKMKIHRGLGHLSASNGEIQMGGIIAIVILLVAYYRFPWIFEGFVNYAFKTFNQAIQSGGNGSQKHPPSTVPVTTTKR
jgi:hypothetical protein